MVLRGFIEITNQSQSGVEDTGQALCIVCIVENRVERLNESRTNRKQLVTMRERKIPQYFFSLWGEGNKNFPLISFIPAALNKTALNEPINQFDRPMMREL